MTSSPLLTIGLWFRQVDALERKYLSIRYSRKFPSFSKISILLASRFLITSLEWGFKRNKVQKPVFYSIIIALALPNIVWSAKHTNQLLQKDTRLMAKEWIEENIPAGSHILIESFKLSDFILLSENKESLYRKYLRYKSIIEKIPNYKGHALLRKKIEMENVKEPSYRIDYFYLPASRIEMVHDEFSSYIMPRGVSSVDEYKRKGVNYIVTARYKSSGDFSYEEMRNTFPDFYKFFKTLERECRLVKVFRYENSLESRKPFINPEIKIYSLE